MAFMAGNITALLSIKIKTRHDDYTDQVSRICVVKILVVCSLVMGIDFFHDTVSCIPPTSKTPAEDIPAKYIQSACWIKGFYVYPDLSMPDAVYYGIPPNLDATGRSGVTGEACQTKDIFYERKKGSGCKPMKKRYMRQYQWMPFFIASMALLFYAPYIIYRVVNTDMISLRANVNDQVDRDEIVQNYFNHSINSVPKMRMRVFMNVIIKLLYVIVNIITFVTLDSSLDNHFLSYGTAWVSWTRLNSTMQLDFESRSTPTPGNRMLPSFGICDLADIRKSIGKQRANHVIMVCEISSHVLYHYVFLLLWFVLALSTGVSIFGVLLNILSHINNVKFSRSRDSSKSIYQFLTIRECEYLEFIRRRNLATYGSVMAKLRHTKTLLRENDIAKGTIHHPQDGALQMLPTDAKVLSRRNNGISNGTAVRHHLQDKHHLQDEQIPMLKSDDDPS